MAAPNMPRRLWTLDTLEPGMGLIVRLSGVHAVEWTRERADAYPVVELDAIYNLVAWMGTNHTALNQALSAIGPPLRGGRVWSADGDTTVHKVGQDLQREALSLPIAHRTPLWVNVDRATYWLQSVLRPTHIHWFKHPDIDTDRNKQGTRSSSLAAAPSINSSHGHLLKVARSSTFKSMGRSTTSATPTPRTVPSKTDSIGALALAHKRLFNVWITVTSSTPAAMLQITWYDT